MDSTGASSSEWAVLIAAIAVLLVADLFIIRSRGGEMSLRAAAIASVFWVGVALAFFGYLVLTQGSSKGEAYLAGYLIEKSLSLDNVFVFLLILTSFAIPANDHHRLLTYGVIGALVMRAIFIVVGSAALAKFGWISIPFALLVLWTGLRLWRHRHDHEGEQKLVEGLHDRLPISKRGKGKKLVIERRGKRLLTPAGGALAAIMLADLLFAVDSVPAILAITTDTYIVWAANAFALLGLRPLFFLVAELVERLYYLKAALALLLIFVGLKLGLSEFTGKLPPAISLGVIGGILAVGVIASLVRNRRLASAS